MFEHALVAVDLGQDWAALGPRLPGLRRLGTSRLTLVHVASPGFPVAAEAAHRRHQQSLLRAAETAMRQLGFEVAGEIRVGDLELELDRAMEQSGAAYLVAGTHPRGPLHDLVVGNPVLELARIAARAVWLEPLSGPAASGGGGGLLLATDGSDAAAPAERAAMKMLPAFGRGLAVWVKHEGWLGGDDAIHEVDVDIHMRALRDACPSMETRVAAGDPATEIRRIAIEEGSDVIILGKRGQNRIAGLLLGRTAERICRRAPTAVLLVPELPAEAD